MRLEDLYLVEIIEAADDVSSWLGERGKVQWDDDTILRHAILQRLTVVGQAARRLSDATRQRHASVPWARIIAFRNVVVHEYFRIEWDEVWRIATEELPVLRRQVVDILEEEFPETFRRWETR
jgi:uncharacterized protein with HEPN domain